MDKVLTIKSTSNIQFLDVARALDHPVRLQIMNLLASGGKNITEIAEALELTYTTVATNVKILEDAGLIITLLSSGKRGTIKQCSIKYENITFSFIEPKSETGILPYSVELPLGGFSDCNVTPTCGLASSDGFIGRDDDVKTFYLNTRFSAQLLWFNYGYVEYRFPNTVDGEIVSIEFSVELCSEAPGYKTAWPSDITAWINGVEIGTWTCPGDFGGRRGKLTPSWWSLDSTQYGLLKTWEVDALASYIDKEVISSHKLSDLFLTEKEYISFRLGIKKNATNLGGINIFGKEFGDYPQDLKMTIYYKKK